MPIYKLDALERDAEKVSHWLSANGISPQNCFAPSFIDTDANVLHWVLVVTPFDSSSAMTTYAPDGSPVHSCVVGQQLEQYGLYAPALGAGSNRVGIQMETPLIVPPPAEILAVA